MAKKVYANINLGPLTPIFRFKVVIILTNWIFQGILYADKTEKMFKLLLDFTLTIILYFFLIQFSNAYLRLIFSLIMSHTLLFIFNGQLFALAKNFDIVYNEPQGIIDYANGIKKRASKEKSINCLVVYGSLVRGEIKPTSDLDIRVIRKSGVLNGFRACIFGLKERSRALFSQFPLDMYVIDNPNHLLKMRHDESPKILYDPNHILGQQKDAIL
jgi:predicted nucleotidyltransferase